MKVPIDDYACIDLDCPCCRPMRHSSAARYTGWSGASTAASTTGTGLLRGIERPTATTMRARIVCPTTLEMR